MVGGQGGVGVAHGLAQADQGAHGIEQQALGRRQGHSLGQGHGLGQDHSLGQGHGLGPWDLCQRLDAHRQSASQPAATRSWWDSPGMRAR